MDFKDFIDKDCFNIWRYAKLYRKFVNPKFRLSVGEGWTKEETFSKLNRKLKIKHLYFKREDFNPLFSFKVRGLAYQISRAWQEDERRTFCISSTGNAAVAAAAFCRMIKAPIFIFMHKKPRSKRKRKVILKKIRKFEPEKTFFEKEPTRRCQEFSKRKDAYNLTPSVDPWSPEGFKSIGFEIFEKVGEVQAIFSFSSSGTSIIGIGKSFKFLSRKGLIKNLPQLYSIKKGVIKREKEVKKIVKESKGEVFEVKKATRKARDLLLNFGISTSIEGILAFSGFLEIQKERKFKDAVLILSGRRWS